jgi:hypothetical protein
LTGHKLLLLIVGKIICYIAFEGELPPGGKEDYLMATENEKLFCKENYRMSLFH